MECELHLPWPPSNNTYYRHVGHRTLLSRKAHAYRKTVLGMLKDRVLPEFTGEIELYAEFYPPDKRKRDLDNLLKGLQDTLQHAGLFRDDSQIVHLDIVKKEPHRPDGRAYVRIKDYVFPKQIHPMPDCPGLP